MDDWGDWVQSGPTLGMEWLFDEGRWKYTVDGVEVERPEGWEAFDELD